jgi:hypothetical protein
LPSGAVRAERGSVTMIVELDRIRSCCMTHMTELGATAQTLQKDFGLASARWGFEK